MPPETSPSQRSMHALVRVAIDMSKCHDQSSLGRKEFMWLTLPPHSSSSKEVRTQTVQELRIKELINHGGELLPGSFIMLAQPTFLSDPGPSAHG